MKAIDELLAKQAIREQLFRYCRSMDRRDDALGRTVFTEDCTMDYGQNFQGSGWEFVAWAHKAHDRAYEQTSHQITNMLIRLSEDGTKAISETYLTPFSSPIRMKTAAPVSSILRPGIWTGGFVWRESGRSRPAAMCRILPSCARGKPLFPALAEGQIRKTHPMNFWTGWNKPVQPYRKQIRNTVPEEF